MSETKNECIDIEEANKMLDRIQTNLDKMIETTELQNRR